MRKVLLFALLVPLAAFAGPGDREALRRAAEQLLSQPPLAGAHVAVEVESLDRKSVV